VNILGRWGPPPKMDEEQYKRYRIRLALIMLTWLASAIGVIFFWEFLNWPIRIIVIVAGTVIIPDVELVRQIFVPYAKYVDEGIN
jgi:hypothetical protein